MVSGRSDADLSDTNFQTSIILACQALPALPACKVGNIIHAVLSLQARWRNANLRPQFLGASEWLDYVLQ